jgi:hypothetical protein
MTKATREALERVNQILHEAGWDQPVERPNGASDQDLVALRDAYGKCLRTDHFEILEKILDKGWTAEQAGGAMGLTPGEARNLFGDALRRLSDFVHTYEGRKAEASGT